MAVEYSKAVSDLNDRPLNSNEKGLIDVVEGYIDELIKTRFDDTWINIPLYIMDYNFNVNNINERGYNTIKLARIAKMQEELKSRYVDAGWEWKLHLDDGLDGPNMSGPDYWKLRGKNND